MKPPPKTPSRRRTTRRREPDLLENFDEAWAWRGRLVKTAIYRVIPEELATMPDRIRVGAEVLHALSVLEGAFEEMRDVMSGGRGRASR